MIDIINFTFKATMRRHSQGPRASFPLFTKFRAGHDKAHKNGTQENWVSLGVRQKGEEAEKKETTQEVRLGGREI